MACILTAMRGQMWCNIGKNSSVVGWDMSDDSIDGTMMGQNSHARMDSLSLVRLDAFALSWSHMTNRPSFKTTSATQDGPTQIASQSQRPRAMARHLWCRTS